MSPTVVGHTGKSVSVVEHARERGRRITRTAVAGTAGRVVQIAAGLALVPLLLDHLGREGYGVWATILSFAGLVGFADFGIGFGMVNAVAAAYGRDDRDAARRYVSSAMALLLGIALALGAVAAVLAPHVSWSQALNTELPEATTTVGVFIVCFLAGIPLTAMQKAADACQDGHRNHLAAAGGALAGLAAAAVAVGAGAGLPVIALAILGSRLAAHGASGLDFFLRARPYLRPRLGHVTRPALREVTRNGLLFLTLQLAMAIGFQSDTLILAHMLGPEQVPGYSVPLSLYMLGPTFLAFALAPLWPAYGEAWARGDRAWVRGALRRSLWVSAGANLAFALILFFAAPALVRLWVGPDIRVSSTLRISLGLWIVVQGLMTPLAMFLNGLNVVRLQVITASAMAITNILVSVFLVTRIGLPGVVYGSVIAVFVVSFLPALFYTRRLLCAAGVRAPMLPRPTATIPSPT